LRKSIIETTSKQGIEPSYLSIVSVFPDIKNLVPFSALLTVVCYRTRGFALLVEIDHMGDSGCALYKIVVLASRWIYTGTSFVGCKPKA
jgi:hypothetical protein